MSEYRKTIENLIRDILGDFPQGFNRGFVAGVPGWAGDMAYLAQEYPRALLTDTPLRPPVEYAGTTDSIAKAAGYEIPGTFSGQLGAAVGGLLSPGPGDLAKFAPLGAMFLGTKAATASQDALSLAKAMDAAGASRDEIWKATGELGQPWMKGPDGQWRFEISDDASKFIDSKLPSAKNRLEIATDYLHQQGIRPTLDIGSPDSLVPPNLKQEALQYADMKVAKGAPSAPLSTVLQHGNFFMNYPEMGSMPISREVGGQIGIRGRFDPETGALSVGGGETIGASGPLQSTALHELQHAVQQREGFARGGSPGFMAAERDRLLARINYLNTEMSEAAKGMDKAPKGSEEFQQYRSAYDAALNEKLSMPIEVVQGDPFEAYRLLAGEAEARNVQSRMNMTMPERLATPPWKTLDVPEEQLIVRKGLLDGPALSIPFWHGSPHKFDAFDLSKMGTGEGAQAYGWGAYGADSADVAKTYVPRDYNMEDDLLALYKTAERRQDYDAMQVFEDAMLHKTADEIAAVYPDRNFADAIEKVRVLERKQNGHLYQGEYAWPDPAKEAATPLTGEDLLQWDKPLSEQPETVRRALEVLAQSDTPAGRSARYALDMSADPLVGGARDPRLSKYSTGEGAYTLISDDLGRTGTSKALLEAGIPGIRYLDGQSRDGGSGTYNYVMFDDKGIKLLERNGKPIGGLLDKKR